MVMLIISLGGGEGEGGQTFSSFLLRITCEKEREYKGHMKMRTQL